MLRGWLDLIEARVQEARARVFAKAAKPGPIEDQLASLPAEARMAARIAANVGGAPPEVDKMREVRALAEAEAKATDPGEKAAIHRRLRDAEIERNVILEKTGRAVLLTGMLEGGAGADHTAPAGDAEQDAEDGPPRP